MNENDTRPHPLSRLWQYAAGYRRTIRLATTFTIINKLFDLMPPVLVGVAVDVVVQQQDSFIARLGISDVTQQLTWLGLFTLLVWGVESLTEYIFRVQWRNLAQTMQHQLRLDAYDHVQRLELSFFEDQSTGGLLSILNDDINQLERFLDNGASSVIHLLTTLLVVGALFVALAPQRGLDGRAADALYHLGLTPFPGLAGAALRPRTHPGGHPQRLPGQQPGRDRHHQELRNRDPRAKAHRPRKR